MLAMAANKHGRVGSQFLITFAEMPILDRKDLNHDLRKLSAPISQENGVKKYLMG
jgi:cyclophilin family peptidyl-prolyl cis-trans isomerase